MKLSKIYSTRNSNNKVYSDLIYEWEDDYAKELNIKIYSYLAIIDKLFRYFFKFSQKIHLGRILQYLDSKRKPKSYVLVHELYPRSYFSHQVFCNKIPIIIDFDYGVNLASFFETYRNCKLVFISNLEAFHYLNKNNCPLNIAHLPLSLSDRHKIDKNHPRKTEFDVIMVRPNNVFLDYLERFALEHQDFEYVIRKWDDSKLYSNNVYYSNKKGVIGEFSERDLYLNLLRKAKVALYSTPGLDDPNTRFMNHVTPSLFEFVAAGCKVITRFPKNHETDFFELYELSPSVNSYEEFEYQLGKIIYNKSFDYLTEHQKFLDKNYTSCRVNIINLKIGELK